MSAPSETSVTASSEGAPEVVAQLPETARPTIPADRSRARFLRACDRCRARKVKCDEKDPCERCAKGGIRCTFDGDPKLLASSLSKSRKRRHSPSGSTSVKRKASSPREDDQVMQANRESPWTAHFFIGQDGTPRMFGPTSALPVIDALRRATSTLKKHDSPLGDPDWSSLSRMLMGDEERDVPVKAKAGETGEEFFPNRQSAPSPLTTVDLLATVSGIIPQDLMASLLQLFFDIIHPCWPIVHAVSFFEDLYRWTDPGCAALMVSMCMVASRYTTDRRVLASASDPTSAGLHYHELFRQLANFEQGSGFYHLMAYFFAGQFFCTDNVPRPLGYTYFSIALSRAVDAGLHRGVPSNVPIGAVEREVRKRTAWALFCLDKQIAALFGRHPFIRLVQIDVDVPEIFPDADENSNMACMALDKKYVEIFRAFTSVSAVLDFTLNQVVHNPVYPKWEFVNKVAEFWDKASAEGLDFTLNQVVHNPVYPKWEFVNKVAEFWDKASAEGLEKSEALLKEWQKDLTPSLSARDTAARVSSPLYSIASEQVAATETFVLLLISTRRLFLATINGPGMEDGDTRQHSREIGQRLRAPIILHARSLIQSCIQLGAAGRLQHADIFIVYRVLAAGRLLVACSLSAETDDDRKHKSDSRQAVQAASILLHRMVALFPIALGAAETLDETCRVCGISIDSPSTHNPTQNSVWYRPLRQRTSRQTGAPLVEEPLQVVEPLNRSHVDELFGGLDATIADNTFWPYDAGFLDPDSTNGALSFLDTELPPEGMELSWLLSHAGQTRL